MKNLFRKIFFVCCIIFLGLGALVLYYRWKERVGFRNIDACKKLKPGITITELEKTLGPPVHLWVSGEGEKWVAFETPSINAGPISAEIENSTGKVLTLRCFEDGPPTWTMK